MHQFLHAKDAKEIMSLFLRFKTVVGPNDFPFKTSLHF